MLVCYVSLVLFSAAPCSHLHTLTSSTGARRGPSQELLSRAHRYTSRYKVNSVNTLKPFEEWNRFYIPSISSCRAAAEAQMCPSMVSKMSQMRNPTCLLLHAVCFHVSCHVIDDLFSFLSHRCVHVPLNLWLTDVGASRWVCHMNDLHTCAAALVENLTDCWIAQQCCRVRIQTCSAYGQRVLLYQLH